MLLSITKLKVTEVLFNMKVINLFGSSGAGKSTQALGLAYELKKRGIKCEYISEYAKELVFSGCSHLLTQNQLFVFSEQLRRMNTLRNTEIQYLVVDSPLLLGLFYGKKYNTTSRELNSLIINEFNTYDNTNIFLTRTAPFEQFGRVQQEEESNQDSLDLKQLLLDNHVHFIEEESNDSLAAHLAYKILTNKL